MLAVNDGSDYGGEKNTRKEESLTMIFGHGIEDPHRFSGRKDARGMIFCPIGIRTDLLGFIDE
jgi:hypothetical protein